MSSDLHPNSFAPPSVWARLIWRNGGVPPRYWGRLAGILALSLAATPLRVIESLRWSRRVSRTSFDGRPPLFVLGFARSGTTHLQNLLTQDPQFGYLTTFQMLMPTFALMGKGWLKNAMEKGMERRGPRTRPMDNVAIGLDSAQEEEPVSNFV